MKRLLFFLLTTALLPVSMAGQPQKGNFQKGDYGYLYCHMNDHGRAWTAYALSRDGQPVTAAEKTIVLQRDNSKQIFGTGHHAVVQKPGTDEWYIVYHRFQRPRGAKLDWSAGYNREVCIDRLTFDSKGNIIPVKPTL